MFLIMDFNAIAIEESSTNVSSLYSSKPFSLSSIRESMYSDVYGAIFVHILLAICLTRSRVISNALPT